MISHDQIRNRNMEDKIKKFKLNDENWMRKIQEIERKTLEEQVRVAEKA